MHLRNVAARASAINFEEQAVALERDAANQVQAISDEMKIQVDKL